MLSRNCKVGTRVKVVKCSDPHGVPIDPKYMGLIGEITRGGDSKSVHTMPQVTFPDGSHDAFWPEELRKVCSN